MDIKFFFVRILMVNYLVMVYHNLTFVQETLVKIRGVDGILILSFTLKQRNAKQKVGKLALI